MAGLVVLVGLVVLGLYAQHRYSFDWHKVAHQFAQANWGEVGLAIGCIYLAFIVRAIRWAWLIRHSKRVPLLSLLDTQVIGFTAVALIGRLADPVRPFLVSKKTRLPLSNQVAVYVLERLFDAGTMAFIFSVAMLGIPTDQIVHATSHSHLLSILKLSDPRAISFAVRYGVLVLTLLGFLFLLAIRMSGELVAVVMEKSFSIFSAQLGSSAGHKIRAFRSGLDTMRHKSDFAMISALSIAMWILIALSYLLSCRAFVASPELAAISPQKSVLLMVASGGASIFQLPVIGWFTQIIAVAAILTAGFGVAKEAATAGAATLLLVTFLSIVPVGLVWAQIEHVSLRKVTVESEHAEEALESAETTEAADTAEQAEG
ncbi:MAG TPA: lysylphosphatidylglycerol synthase transmembrane domain-containing protein [Terracidiphilus sp.]|nr:lysylphosphatidylglycerol synthase transmembrane domain-containing protein [Terracidiphilus sp.]